MHRLTRNFASPHRSPKAQRSFCGRARGEDGQSLIVVAAAMFLIIVMAALAIDVATWYQKHHQAQVAADAAALAAANCLANASGAGVICTSATDTSDAVNMATTYAANNSFTLTDPSQVTVDTTAGNVTVTTASSAPVFFSSLLGLTPTVSARAVATYKLGKVPVSLFAGNNSCATGTGIVLAAQDNGGGTTHIDGLWTNGLYTNNNSSNASSMTGEYSSNSTGTAPYCPKDSAVTESGSAPYGGSKNSNLTSSGNYSSTSSFPNWPAPYSPPTCGNTASSWSTNSGSANVIIGGGVYCASGTASSCSSTTPSGTPGTIYLNATVSNVEVYASCVIIGPSANVTAPNGAPAVFSTGASNSADAVVFATGASVSGAIFAPGWCTTAASPSTLVLAAPNLTSCTSGTMVGGVVEVTGNNATSGFVEGETVIVDKNGFTFTGTGPLTVSGTDALIN